MPFIVPVIFCCAALFSAVRGLFSVPIQALCAGIFVAAEVGIYYTFVDGLRYRPAFLVRPGSESSLMAEPISIEDDPCRVRERIKRTNS